MVAKKTGLHRPLTSFTRLHYHKSALVSSAFCTAAAGRSPAAATSACFPGLPNRQTSDGLARAVDHDGRKRHDLAALRALHQLRAVHPIAEHGQLMQAERAEPGRHNGPGQCLTTPSVFRRCFPPMLRGPYFVRYLANRFHPRFIGPTIGASSGTTGAKS